MTEKSDKRVILIVLDGWGVSLREAGNAIAAAATPTFDYLTKNYPLTTLKASGISVGLTWHESGNSEVGHMTLGTGRIIYQYLPRIISAIRDGSFFENPALLAAAENVKKNPKARLHLVGLIGSGSVHSYIDHLYALLDLAKLQGLSGRVRLHLITDGRDSLPTEGAKFIQGLMERLSKQETGQIASVVGRFYAMDRDLNWDRTAKAWHLMVEGQGEKVKPERLVSRINDFYEKGINDTYLEPLVVIDSKGNPEGLVSDGDSLIFFNYREDRIRQLTRSFILPQEAGFKVRSLKVKFITLTQYDESLPVQVAFPPPEIKDSLGELVSEAGFQQLRLAETEKYAHVTYFFNGAREEPLLGEKRSLVPSDDIPSFAKKPEMQTPEITRRLLEHILQKKYQFVLVNFANPDMLAHTGDFEATILGIQELDKQLSKIIRLIESDPNNFAIITADHGNAERMLDPYTGEKLTEHSTNNVPFIVVNSKLKTSKDPLELRQALQSSLGLLADVAPTILDILGLDAPPEMTGSSLLKELKIKL